MRCLTPLLWSFETAAPPTIRNRWVTGTAAECPLLLLLDCPLPLSDARAGQLNATLTLTEQQRLRSYRRRQDGELFLVGRAALRQLLGHWCDQPPQSVSLQQGPHGKPFCPGGPQFNVSHSGGLVLLGLHPSRSVGVDVERPRPELAWEPLARRVLRGEELSRLLELPEVQQRQAFLRAWCRLEARLKAHGCGLAGLEALQAATPSGHDPPISLWDVDVPAGHAAAAALGPSQS